MRRLPPLNPGTAKRPNETGIISTEMLEQQIPGFGWNGGHSGREISGAQLKRLDAMWAEFESSWRLRPTTTAATAREGLPS